jgi:hypothetical protein
LLSDNRLLSLLGRRSSTAACATRTPTHGIVVVNVLALRSRLSLASLRLVSLPVRGTATRSAGSLLGVVRSATTAIAPAIGPVRVVVLNEAVGNWRVLNLARVG